ncbi:hypothetical protein ACFFJ4_16425 [Xanthomonas dyei]|uniref:NADP-dependent oxidoreductase domain-containing protein n=1 Tax=Xanthomonas dyei TaxID=743699 RepID=A0A2S7BYL5_9XANT|nr:hypothetical protein [Xanthomonas dyei]PPU54401.1 hypothetical protein XdyCFBP7245_18255 [Xanthomonas dyei]WOB24481.1 hypothetical protein NYR99_11620 [Xanthomonas dyei]WOB52109.1 hypothetical protein NYR95_11625 [Xanthomonas dyei]
MANSPSAQTTQARDSSGQSYIICKRKLGKLKVSELGFGCMRNSPGHCGPGMGRAISIRVIRDAYDRGIRFFDTAGVYDP